MGAVLTLIGGRPRRYLLTYVGTRVYLLVLSGMLQVPRELKYGIRISTNLLMYLEAASQVLHRAFRKASGFTTLVS